MSFCGLIKGISPKLCILRVRVEINKRSFEPFCVWICGVELGLVASGLMTDVVNRCLEFGGLRGQNRFFSQRLAFDFGLKKDLYKTKIKIQ